MTWTWDSFWFNILTSFIGSFAFILYILVFLRPRIKIAGTIAKTKDDDGKDCFVFKFYNCSIFSAFDVYIDLITMEERHAEPKGKHIVYEKVDLEVSEYGYLNRWMPQFLCKNFAHHCVQIKTYENLDKILSQNQVSLQIKIVLRHGLTGLGKNFIKDYHTVHKIKSGEFAFGNSFAILD